MGVSPVVGSIASTLRSQGEVVLLGSHEDTKRAVQIDPEGINQSPWLNLVRFAQI
jgi:hypothetical protein